MVDGIKVAGECCVAGLVVTADGTKVGSAMARQHREQDGSDALLADLV